MSPENPATSEDTGYLSLFCKRKKEVVFATLLNFGSSYGQTFFISLVLPAMALSAGVSLETAGSFYAVATVLSAVLLALTGHWADRLHPRMYATLCMSILGMAALLASQVDSWITLFLALALVRWSGQGLLPHASNVAIAKSFPKRPGAPYAVASLGFPIGEACFPALIVATLSIAQVSTIWVGFGALVFLVWLPLLWWTGGACRMVCQTEATNSPKDASSKQQESAPLVWLDRRIWWLLPHLFAVPFVMTAILFYQSLLTESTGWSPWLWATGLSSYALARALLSVLAGGWFARRDALPWLAWSKIPMAAGTLLVAMVSSSDWVLLTFFLLSGATMGAQMVVGKTALVELYGPEIIGRAKAATNAVIVLSTAAAPPVMATLAGLFNSWTAAVLGGSAVVMIGATVWTALAVRVLRRPL